MKGVYATRSGWIGKVEVTEVRFDPRQIGFADLLAHGKKHDCASSVFPTSPAQKKVAAATEGVIDRGAPGKIRLEGLKYHLGRTPLRALPLTSWQAARINARQAQGLDLGLEELLAPGQRDLLARIAKEPQKSWPSAIGVPLPKAWAALEAKIGR